MLQEREKALYASFEASLGENNEFADFLTNILKTEVECVEKEEVGREAGWILFFLIYGFVIHISMWSSTHLSDWSRLQSVQKPVGQTYPDLFID